MGDSEGRLVPGFSSKLNLILDLALLGLSLILGAGAQGVSALGLSEFCALTALLCLAWVIPSALCRYYDPWMDRTVADDTVLGSTLTLLATASLAGLELVFPATPLPSPGIFLLCFWPGLIAVRLCIARKLQPLDDPLAEVLIVGAGPLAEEAATRILARGGRRRLVGCLGFAEEPRSLNLPAPVLGTSEALERVLRQMPVSEVYVAGDASRCSAAMQRAVATCERFGIPFALPAPAFSIELARPSPSGRSLDGFIHYQTVPAQPYQLALKRGVDLVVAGSAFVLLSPVIVLTALAVACTSKGGVLFRQTRVGLHGRPFEMLKFRSMVSDAESQQRALLALNEASGPVFKMRWDPRITPVGRFIRKFSIDELPQLWNVLTGEMSIVGPRPPISREVEQYETWQRRRLSVRPGLTCSWQVSGRSDLAFEEWMRLDLSYIDQWSLWQDFALIVRTVPAVLRGRGAR
jgi:exopolysaccharide biosynthesis polyprenyl glycosylphosphotransferase